MKDRIVIIICILGMLIFTWLSVTGITWQVRNPKANQTTLFTYFPDVITFKKLEKFQ